MRKNTIYLLPILVFVISCTTEHSNKTEKTVEALESFIKEKLDYPIPTSLEVSQMLQEAQAIYQPDIVNDPENNARYVTEWQKALNLGVYGADLSYASTFDKQEETMALLEASKKLIDDLNISTIYNSQMVQRMEANLGNKDSLIRIISESFYDTYHYLNRNGAEKTSVLVVAGSVVEGLFITSELIISSNYNDRLMEVFAKQKSHVRQLVELMEGHAEDENVNRVLPTLRYISLYYDQIGEDEKLSKGAFDDIASSIREMRSS
ncbi:MAG: hypothetical protein OEY56_15080, partial [Cyclobacteriaceae bacterium]|nr:hypothetical protein [Cyclobacteriaceae bacterium]